VVAPYIHGTERQIKTFSNSRAKDYEKDKGEALVEGAAQISRDDTRRRIVVSTNVRDRDIATFVDEAKQRIEKEVRFQNPPKVQSKAMLAVQPHALRVRPRLLVASRIARI
jgi:hypothetical protein